MTQIQRHIYLLGRDEGEGLWFLGSHVALKVTGAESSGAVTIMESHAPRGHGSPLHVHTREDETFHVIEGELRVEIEDEVYVVGPGATAFGPRNLRHRFTVTSQEARFLLIASPAGIEDFVRAGAQPATETRIPDPVSAQPPDLEAMAAVAAEYGIEILGPPVQL